MTTPLARARPPLRELVREIMEPYQGGPESTVYSLVLDLFVLFCILGSIALIPLDHFYPQHSHLFWQLEMVFTGIFCVEYVARFYAARSRLRYPFTFYAIIDLVAILPSLLMLGQQFLALRAIRGIRLLRLLRLLRVVRLLKFVRYGHLLYRALVSFRIWFSTMNYQYRLWELGRLSLYVAIAWVVGANMLHFTETSLADDPGPFTKYWDSYWNILIVLVSGIEDKEPLSLLGRIEMTAMMITGIVIVGMLTGEIVAILVRKAERAGKVAIKPPRGKLSGHFVILGTSSHVDAVIRELYTATAGKSYILVVAPDAENLPVTDPVIYRRVFGLSGDPVRLEVIEQAQIEAALRVVVLASDEPGQPPHLVDNRTLMEALAVMSRKAGKPLVAEIRDQQTLDEVHCLEDAGVEFILSRDYGEGLIAQAVLNPGVSEVFGRLMTFDVNTNELYTVPVPEELLGKTFRDAQLHFLDRDAEPVLPVGVDRSPPLIPHSQFMLNPVAGQCDIKEDDLTLRPGDSLIIMAYERPSFAHISKEQLWTGAILPRT